MKNYKMITGERKYLPIKEAAKLIGVSRASLRKWFAEHPTIDNNPDYVRKEPYGKVGVKRFISEAGIVAYDVEKEGFRGNQYKKTVSVSGQDTKRSTKYVQALENRVSELQMETMVLTSGLNTLSGKMDLVIKLLESDVEKKPALAIQPRDEIRMLVNEYAKNFDIPYSMVWNLLYQRAYYVLGYNVKQRTKKTTNSKLEQFEEDGKIDDLLMVAREMLKK